MMSIANIFFGISLVPHTQKAGLKKLHQDKMQGLGNLELYKVRFWHSDSV